MSLTDIAGITGLIAAALLGLWMLLGARTQSPAARTARHRGNPSLRLSRAVRPGRAARGN